MKLEGKAKMVRIHFGEDDTWNGKPLFRAIVEKCRELDIAGATVFRGIEGYGASTLIHRSHLLSFSSDAPGHGERDRFRGKDSKTPAAFGANDSRRPDRHLGRGSHQVRPSGWDSLVVGHRSRDSAAACENSLQSGSSLNRTGEHAREFRKQECACHMQLCCPCFFPSFI